MKKILTNLLMVLVMFGFICLPAVSTGAKSTDQNVKVNFGDQDFILINSTGVEIYALYVSPHSANQWGEDILGADTLFNGEDLLIYFPLKTKTKFWDLRVEDEDGDFIEWHKLNLLKISSVELLFEKGKPTAILN